MLMYQHFLEITTHHHQQLSSSSVSIYYLNLKEKIKMFRFSYAHKPHGRHHAEFTKKRSAANLCRLKTKKKDDKNVGDVMPQL